MPIDYQVKNGDCISSIAFNYGFFWETLWADGSNSALKSKRKDPNILKEGDVVHIPDLTPKEESGATEQKHKFKLKGVPAKLRLRLIHDRTPDETVQRTKFEEWSFETETEKPRATEPLKEVSVLLYVDEQLAFEGQTDADGCIEASISPGAKTGRVKLYPGTEKEAEIPLELGCVEPVDEPPGVVKRLHNLGYNCSAETEDESEELQMAIKEFQTNEGLDATGNMDQQTRDALKNAHGG